MPPHDILAEQAVLGSALIDSTPLPPPADFYREAHQLIATAMHSLRERGVGIDLITVCNELRESGKLDLIGGPEGIDGLVSAVQTSANAAHYALIVRERAAERRAETLCDQLKEQIAKGRPLRVLLPRFLPALTKLNVESNEPIEMSDALTALAADIEGGRDSERIFTGIDCLDEMLQGLRTKQLIAIGGAPATGKSAFALQVAVHVALQYGAVGLVSQEMRHDEVAERVAAQQSGQRIRVVTRDPAEVRRVAKRLSGVSLPVYDWRMSPADFIAHMRAMKAKQPTMAAFVLDYAQLMKRDGVSAEKEHEFLNEAMPLIKGLCQELNCVGLVLAQLKADARSVGIEPNGESFRSPAILENADKAAILWRDGNDSLYAKVVKNRQGPTGNVELTFDKESVTFRDPNAAPMTPAKTAARGPHRFPSQPVAFDDIPL